MIDLEWRNNVIMEWWRVGQSEAWWLKFLAPFICARELEFGWWHTLLVCCLDNGVGNFRSGVEECVEERVSLMSPIVLDLLFTDRWLGLWALGLVGTERKSWQIQWSYMQCFSWLLDGFYFPCGFYFCFVVSCDPDIYPCIGVLCLGNAHSLVSLWWMILACQKEWLPQGPAFRDPVC